jgi:hypothetical protein
MSKAKKKPRNELLQIRVTEQEKNTIMANANGNASDWLRSFGLNPNDTQKPRITTIAQDPKLVAEIAKIGNNINQLARQANSLPKTGNKLDLVLFQATLEESNALLAAIVKQGL